MPTTDAAIEAAKPDQYRDLPLIVAAELRVTSDHDHRTWGEVKRALEVWRKIAAFHHLSAPAAGGLSEEAVAKTLAALAWRTKFGNPLTGEGSAIEKWIELRWPEYCTDARFIIDRLAASPAGKTKALIEEARDYLTSDADVTDSQRIANASVVLADALDELTAIHALAPKAES